MTITEVKDYLANLTGHVTFCYNGYDCGIDPLATDEFSMWYDTDEITVNSIDKVMNINFFDGKSLKDIWGDITELEF